MRIKNTLKTKAKQNTSQGITLIALVVTVIFLLILAGITLNLLFGENGLLNKASLSNIMSTLKTAQETCDLMAADEYTKYYNDVYVKNNGTYNEATINNIIATALKTSQNQMPKNVTISAKTLEESEDEIAIVTLRYAGQASVTGGIQNGNINWGEIVFEEDNTGTEIAHRAAGLYLTTSDIFVSWDDLVTLGLIFNGYLREEEANLSTNYKDAFVMVWDYGSFNFCWNNRDNEEGELVIIDDNSVTSIGFIDDGEGGLTSIDIPESVTYIADGAFHGCSGLTSIDIPQSVTYVGDGAFYGCSGLTSITIPDAAFAEQFNDDEEFYSSKFEGKVEVVITGGTSIGNNAFQNWTGLTSITLPNGLTSIGSGAFQNCHEITEVTFPNGLESIGDGAFSGCNLTSITIPNSVANARGAFGGCENLTKIVVPNDGCLPSCASLYSDEACVDVVITGGSSFGGYGQLYGATGLKSITLPDSLTSIDDNALYGCTGLTSLVIPDGVTKIGDYAFAECTNLTSITVPNSITEMGNYTFERCESLKNLTSRGGNVFNKVYGYNDDNKIVKQFTNLVITGTSIDDNAFRGLNNLTSVTMTANVTSIGNYAFFDCVWLENISLPDSLTSIGDGAFGGCGSLTSITLPEGITSIGDRTFDRM